MAFIFSFTSIPWVTVTSTFPVEGSEEGVEVSLVTEEAETSTFIWELAAVIFKEEADKSSFWVSL